MNLAPECPWYPQELRLGVGIDKRGNEITIHCWDPQYGHNISYHRRSDDVYVGAKEIVHYYSALIPSLPRERQDVYLANVWLERVVQMAQLYAIAGSQPLIPAMMFAAPQAAQTAGIGTPSIRNETTRREPISSAMQQARYTSALTNRSMEPSAQSSAFGSRRATAAPAAPATATATTPAPALAPGNKKPKHSADRMKVLPSGTSRTLPDSVNAVKRIKTVSHAPKFTDSTNAHEPMSRGLTSTPSPPPNETSQQPKQGVKRSISIASLINKDYVSDDEDPLKNFP